MTRLALLTSGGDAPGMNACIRAVTRAAAFEKMEVVGIRHGFQGLVEGEAIPMSIRSVGNIIHQGGTCLGTSRYAGFHKPEYRRQAIDFLKHSEIDYLVTIGGDGTFRGSAAMVEQGWEKVVGVPATIDNDVWGTDYTIGFDTAVNTALAAIDKIRDTAESHERLFFVEVMGREAGFIALEAGIAGGAMDILVPEITQDIEALCKEIERGFQSGRRASIIVVAEGEVPGGAYEIAKKVKECSGMDSRVCVLGHIQRGGSPTARDRVLASRLGVIAVDALVNGRYGIAVGERRCDTTYTPFRETFEKKKPLEPDLLRALRVLSK